MKKQTFTITNVCILKSGSMTGAHADIKNDIHLECVIEDIRKAWIAYNKDNFVNLKTRHKLIEEENEAFNNPASLTDRMNNDSSLIPIIRMIELLRLNAMKRDNNKLATLCNQFLKTVKTEYE